MSVPQDHLPGAAELQQFQLQLGIQQLGQTMRSLAPMLYSYFITLKEQGFTAEEALHLVSQMQTFILAQGQQ